jgi:ATP synthase protein I
MVHQPGFLNLSGQIPESRKPNTKAISQATSVDEADKANEIVNEASQKTKIDPMVEFYRLEKALTLVTLALIAVIFFIVWFFLSLNIALSYLLGAIVGVIYLRLLSKDVERLGRQGGRLGVKGLGLFAALIIVASRWQQLHILPVFFGFLTYKISVFLYMLKAIPFASEETKK